MGDTYEKNKQKKSLNLFNWRDYRIGRKYVTIYLLTTVLSLFAGGLVYFQMNQAKTDIEAIEQSSKRASNMNEMAALVQARDVQIADFIITKKQKYVGAFQKQREHFNTLETQLKSNLRKKKQEEPLKLKQLGKTLKQSTALFRIWLPKLRLSLLT